MLADCFFFFFVTSGKIADNNERGDCVYGNLLESGKQKFPDIAQF